MNVIPDMGHRASNPIPTVGGLKALLLGTSFFIDPVPVIENAYRRYGPVVAFRLLRQRKVDGLVLVGPQYNQEVLTAVNAARPTALWQVAARGHEEQRAFRQSYLGTQGETHKRLAEVTVPHLARRRVVAQFEAMREIATEEVAGWPLGETVDLYDLVRQMAQRVAFTLLFGEGDAGTRREFGRLLVDYHNANWSLLGHFPAINLSWLPHGRLLAKAEELSDFVARWTKARHGAPADTDLRAAYDPLRDGHHGLSDAEIAAHLSFLGFAAYETMSSALTWTLFLVALHPKIHADLADEIAANPLDALSPQQLDELPLLDGVIKEAMRLIPPTPVLPWRTYTRCEIAGIRLERKVPIVLSPQLTHRMPEIFPDPERFLPDRWRTARPSPYEYLPFSGGPRRCPGFLFGTEFMKVALAAVVSRCRPGLQPGAKVDRVYRGITMPKPGIAAVLHPRGHGFERPEVTGHIRQLVTLD